MKKSYIEIFIFFFLSNIYVDFIGRLALSEIWLLLYIPFINWKTLFNKYKYIKKISLFYLLYFSSQVVSEIIVQNAINNTLRGLMVTIMSYLFFIYLFDKTRKNIYLIIVVLVAILINQIIFRNSGGITNSTITAVNISDLNEVAFKFIFGPIIISIILILSYFMIMRFKLVFSIIIISVSFIFFLMDSRSNGLILFLSGAIVLFSNTIIKYRIYFIISLVLFYFSYVLWINGVLNKTIGGEHSYSQAKEMNNPYNPLELLLLGRAEFYVGLQAFIDKPLWGHGTWAIDKTGKYIKMQIELDRKKTKQAKIDAYKYKKNRGTIIPSHSVIVSAGMQNGIFAFISMLIIILTFIKLGVVTLFRLRGSPFIVIITVQLISLLWNSVFSPIPHFRLSLPINFAIILTLYYATYNRNTNIQST